MCVIIAREPKVEIPFAKFESACHVNPHGYGIAVIDRGKMEVTHGFNEKGNNAEALYKALEDAKDQQVVMHLRFQTVGDKGLTNCHPFPSLSLKEHGVDVQFMHNGTVYGFKGKDNTFSDTYHFNKQIVTPLLERSITFAGPAVLKDPFVETILEHYAGTGNVFTLVDNNGELLIINKDSGHEEDGWWASNAYSFNRAHREPVRSTSYSYPTNARGNTTYASGGMGTSTAKGASGSKTHGGASNVLLLPTTTKPNIGDTIKQEAEAVKSAFESPTIGTHVSVDMLSVEEREEFITLVGLDSLEDVTRLERGDVLEMVSLYPEMATLLIMDLLYELYLENAEKVS